MRFFVNQIFDDNHDKDKKVFETQLKYDSKYYKEVLNSSGVLQEFWYEVPYQDMYNFQKGDKFAFILEYFEEDNDLIQFPKFVEVYVTIGSITSTDKLQDDINKGFGELKVEFEQSTDKIIESNNKTQEAIKESNETNKNIFQKIGDILNILNPFSENFFAYKLIELLLNALKSLFIPSDNFFNNWLADLNEYFR